MAATPSEQTILVVEDQEGLPVTQMIEHVGPRITSVGGDRRDGRSDRGRHGRGLGQRCEIDEPHPLIPVGRMGQALFDGETGLPKTARPDHADHDVAGGLPHGSHAPRRRQHR